MSELFQIVKRGIYFWIVVVVAILVLLLLCSLIGIGMSSGSAAGIIVPQSQSYYGGFHDHRL